MSSKTESGPTRIDAEPGAHGEYAASGAQAACAEQAREGDQGGTADVGHVEADQEAPGSWRARFEVAAMARTPRQKQWTIPPQADKGPVNITLRLPEVQVDDSGGRHILIGPEQAEVLGSRLVGIRDWLQEGHDDWVGDDDRDC